MGFEAVERVIHRSTAGDTGAPYATHEKSTSGLRHPEFGNINEPMEDVVCPYQFLDELRRVVNRGNAITTKLLGYSLYIFEQYQRWLQQCDEIGVRRKELISRVIYIPSASRRETLARGTANQ